MSNTSIQLLYKIKGIGSASGLVYKDNSLFIISDNNSFLYEYHIQENQLSRIKLFEKGEENIPKKTNSILNPLLSKEINFIFWVLDPLPKEKKG